MIGIVIQARIGSTRFPNKMLAKLNGTSIIEWVICRTKRSTMVDRVILATADTRENDVLEQIAKRHNIGVFRGAEDDVLGRVLGAAKAFNLNTVVRVCADNPLVCPKEIDKLIRFFVKEKPDYAFNGIPKMGNNYPDGLGAEITSTCFIEKLDCLGTSLAEREHMFMHVWNNQERFVVATFKADPDIAFSDIRLDVDTETDFFALEKCGFNIGDNGAQIIEKVRALTK